EHHGVGPDLADPPKCLFGRRGGLDPVSLVAEELAKRPADAFLVIHHQDAAHSGSSSLARGIVSRKRVRSSILVQDSVPAWSYATRCAWASPRPTPSGLPVTNGSN